MSDERVCVCGHLYRNHLMRMTGECIYRGAHAFPCGCSSYSPVGQVLTEPQEGQQ